MTKSVKDKTGDFYKIRYWDPISLTWKQEASTYDEQASAIKGAQSLAKRVEKRSQAIRLQGKSASKMVLTVVFDTEPST